MNKLTTYIFLALSIGFATQCKIPEIAVHPDLASHADIYRVKGKQGLMINQVVSFGDYTTGKVKRGWTSSYRIPFIVTFQGSKEKIQFDQFSPNGSRSLVYAVSQLKMNEINLANSFFSYPIKYENSFVGVIFTETDTTAWWDFVIHNVDASWGDRSGGFAKSNDGQFIGIKGVKKFEGQKIKNVDVLGFEFYAQDKVIGAVSVVNNGRVWMHTDATTNQRNVMAALASSLMIRQNQLESFNSTMSN